MVRTRNPHTGVHLTALGSFFRFTLGMLIVLAFRCMTALMHPSYRRGEAARIRWGLVSYTVLMFSFVTVYTAMNLNAQSTSFIDNRKFPGQDDQSRGPLGYQAFARSKLPNLIPNLMLLLNCWLANGLLVGSLSGAASTLLGVSCRFLQLYRCYMIYSMGFRVVVVLPFFLYLGCVGAYLVSASRRRHSGLKSLMQ